MFIFDGYQSTPSFFLCKKLNALVPKIENLSTYRLFNRPLSRLPRVPISCRSGQGKSHFVKDWNFTLIYRLCLSLSQTESLLTELKRNFFHTCYWYRQFSIFFTCLCKTHINPQTSDAVKLLDFNIKNDHLALKIGDAQTYQRCPQNAGNNILKISKMFGAACPHTPQHVRAMLSRSAQKPMSRRRTVQCLDSLHMQRGKRRCKKRLPLFNSNDTYPLLGRGQLSTM